MEQELSASPEQQNELENGTGFIKISEIASEILLEHLEPHPLQPRRLLSPADVKILSESIETYGLASPLLVMPRRDAPQHYYILDGSRRWNAVKGLKWEQVPCHIAEVPDDDKVLGLMLAMDGVREDFDPIERGVAFAKLMEMLNITQRELANLLKIQQSEISRCASLKENLCEEVINAYQKSAGSRLTVNHLRELARLKDHPERQYELYQEALEKKWGTKRLRTAVNAVLPGDFRGNHKFNLKKGPFDIAIKANGQGIRAAEVFDCVGAVVDQVFNWQGVHGEDIASWYEKMASDTRKKLQEERELVPAQASEGNGPEIESLKPGLEGFQENPEEGLGH